VPERQDSLPQPLAPEELPADVRISRRLLVSREAFDEILAQAERRILEEEDGLLDA
jgi:hypothetical protein